MKVTVTTDIKDGAPLLGENPLPVFRDRNHHTTPAKYHESMEERHQKLVGYDCATRILPYRMQDRYGRARAPMPLKIVVLENEHLRAKFYVDYGGRLTSLYDKDHNKELVKNNPVFQPGNLAIRDAWLATGIEFNCSQFGHHFLTCSPLYAAKVTDENGEEFLRMYEYERCKGVFYQMDFHLPSGSRLLYLYAKIINPKDVPESTYWWTNIDLPEADGVRVFCASDEVIYYMSPKQQKSYPGYSNMAVGHIPYLDCVPGVDLSYPRNYTFATDYFFQIPEMEPLPWEAAAYSDGFVMFEASTHTLLYHKMFCWGRSVGGQKWQDFLSRPGDGDFFEIQAGLAPTQSHGYIVNAGQTIDFVQAFGSLTVDAGSLQRADWHEAQQTLGSKIREAVGPRLEELRSRYAVLSIKQPCELLNCGSGFGALELRRCAAAGSPYDAGGMLFPEAAIKAEETLWLTLLDKGIFPDAFADRAPVSYMVAPEWKDMLEKALEDPVNRHWHAYLHYGVMLAEAGDFPAALKAFEQSITCRENVWALRNIAALYRTDGNIDKALACYKQLFTLPGAFSDQGFAEEYMALLLSRHDFAGAWAFFQTLPAAFKTKDRLALQSGAAAVEIGELSYVESLLKRDFSVIREGEASTSDIWYKLQARLRAAAEDIPYTSELLENIKAELDPPPEIDFRMTASLEKKKSLR